MAPGLPDLAAVRAVCAVVAKPVNFMAGIKGKSFTVADLTRPGSSGSVWPRPCIAWR